MKNLLVVFSVLFTLFIFSGCDNDDPTELDSYPVYFQVLSNTSVLVYSSHLNETFYTSRDSSYSTTTYEFYEKYKQKTGKIIYEITNISSNTICITYKFIVVFDIEIYKISESIVLQPNEVIIIEKYLDK